MGIKSINKLLKTKCPNAICKTNISQFANQTIFVDTSIFMYKYKYAGDIISNFIRMINKLLSHNIIPIFIFDGKPKENKIIMKERKEKREKAKLKLQGLEEQLINKASEYNITIVDKLPENIELAEVPEPIKKIIEDIERTERQNIRVTYKDFQDLKTLLTTMNITYVQADCESDLMIPYIIDKYKYKPLCLSDDTDFLVHNINLISKFDNRTGIIDYTDIEKVKTDLGLTYNEFVDMCILMGCDYCTSPKGVGPMTSYKIIKKYKSLEEYFKIKTEYDVTKYVEARNIFINKKDIDFEMSEDHKLKNIKKEEFKNICNTFGVSEKLQNNMIKTNNKRIIPITNFFKVKNKK